MGYLLSWLFGPGFLQNPRDRISLGLLITPDLLSLLRSSPTPWGRNRSHCAWPLGPSNEGRGAGRRGGACVPQFGDSAGDLVPGTPVSQTSRESDLLNILLIYLMIFMLTDSYRHRSRIPVLKGDTVLIDTKRGFVLSVSWGPSVICEPTSRFHVMIPRQ